MNPVLLAATCVWIAHAATEHHQVSLQASIDAHGNMQKESSRMMRREANDHLLEDVGQDQDNVEIHSDEEEDASMEDVFGDVSGEDLAESEVNATFPYYRFTLLATREQGFTGDLAEFALFDPKNQRIDLTPGGPAVLSATLVDDMNQTITGSWDPKYALDGDLQTKLMLHVGYSLELRVQYGVVVGSAGFVTSNAAPERDPASFKVFGKAYSGPWKVLVSLVGFEAPQDRGVMVGPFLCSSMGGRQAAPPLDGLPSWRKVDGWSTTSTESETTTPRPPETSTLPKTTPKPEPTTEAPETTTTPPTTTTTKSTTPETTTTLSTTTRRTTSSNPPTTTTTASTTESTTTVPATTTETKTSTSTTTTVTTTTITTTVLTPELVGSQAASEARATGLPVDEQAAAAAKAALDFAKERQYTLQQQLEVAGAVAAAAVASSGGSTEEQAAAAGIESAKVEAAMAKAWSSRPLLRARLQQKSSKKPAAQLPPKPRLQDRLRRQSLETKTKAPRSKLLWPARQQQMREG